jgi:YHS domain-containing protein
MIRAALELVITLIIVLAGRAILTNFVRSLSGNLGAPSKQAANQAKPTSAPEVPTGELHRDPVCGTYVAETSRYQRQIGGQTVFYCSEDCRTKHAMAAR